MACWRPLVLLLLTGLAAAHPFEDDEDTQVVESTIREVRALPPPNFDLLAAGTEYHGSNSGGGHGDLGYLRTHDTKGDKGYQKFDSFHKKGGDSYGFETQSSFGKANAGEKKGQYHTSGSYSEGKKGDEHEGAHSGDTDDGARVVEYEAAGTEDDAVYYGGDSGSKKDYGHYDHASLRDGSSKKGYGHYDHASLRDDGSMKGYGHYDHASLRDGGEHHHHGEHHEGGEGHHDGGHHSSYESHEGDDGY